MILTTNNLWTMNVPEGDIVHRGKILRREGVQRTNIDVAHRVAFAGPDGGEVAAGDNRQRRVAAQGTGLLVLLLVVVGDRRQQMLLLLAAGEARLAGNDIARA